MNVLKKATGYYSGKKKQHTLKTQLLVSLQTEEIIALAFSNGKRHDFQLFKDSRVHAKAETVLEADTGYQGLALIHPNSLLPKKRSKNHPLSKQERKDNREIAKQRIFVEHAIRFVKRFRILSERYRNRRNRFTLRVPAPLKGEGDRLRWRGSLLPAFSIQLPKDKRDKRA